MANFEGIKELEASIEGDGLRIGIVTSRFNGEITEGLLNACIEELNKLGVPPGNITMASVAGALEIPLALQRMAHTDLFDALVALGAVVRGETYHFEIVANNSAQGVSTVQMETGVPIANGILTTDDEDQALARMSAKGAEAGRVAVEMANLLRQIDDEC
ncbi:MAG: 6,7-dimethyl-8-ribityllumazine synthase [Betaproteobacteria bacterium]|nr:6,7-dimethyl-8-ribityllumazine synthase [Betaproteobacteria bacterium]